MVKATLKIYLATSKTNAISGYTPIYGRFSSDGKKAEARLPIELKPEEIIHWNHEIGRVDIKNSAINSYLNSVEDAFMQFKIQHATDSKVFSVRDIRDEVLGIKKNKRVTIYDFANNYYKTNLEKNPNFSNGTKTNYRKALKHLERYVQAKKMQQTSIQNLDYSFASAFTAYLMTDDDQNDRIGMSEVSACGIIKKFRTIYNEAVEKELIPQNPFLRIKLSYRSAEKPKLSLSHFQKFIESSNLSRSEKTVASIFLFMSLTGCSFKDCMHLTLDNLEESEFGTKLRYNRNKSGVESTQFLTEMALELLFDFRKIKNVKIEGRLVPKLTNQQMNRTLKIIAAKFGIHFNLSSHDARHTFRQLLDESDIIDPTVICKLMGWSNKDKMDAIYRKVTDTRLIKTKDQFDEFIQSLINKI